MANGKWRFRMLSLLLLAVVLADGALTGAAFAIARYANDSGSVAVSSFETQNGNGEFFQQADSADGQQVASQEHVSQGYASQDHATQNHVSQDHSPQVALTFDDGPHQTCTPALLDGLKQRGVKATFFLMGENIAGKEELVQRMQADGHLIGNHSYRHIQMTKEGAEQACAEIEQTEQLIQSITGKRPEYLRPPYGAWNEQLECRVNLSTVLWNVDSLDWKFQNTKRIVRRVEKDVKDGDIILMHDIFPTSVEAALQIVDDLQAQGYEFVTVEELLVD